MLIVQPYSGGQLVRSVISAVQIINRSAKKMRFKAAVSNQKYDLSLCKSHFTQNTQECEKKLPSSVLHPFSPTHAFPLSSYNTEPICQ